MTGAPAPRLHQRGEAPGQLAQIVHSQFHADHISGLTTRESRAVVPNAEVLVPEPAWRFWTDDGQASHAPGGMRPGFADVARRFAPYAGRVRPFAPGAEVAPGIRSIATHGHKPGHTVFQVTDGHAGMPVLGDTTNRPGLFARNPGWHAMIDTDPAEASRGALLDRAAAGGVRVTGYHFPFPIAGRIAREGQGCCCCAAEWIDGV